MIPQTPLWAEAATSPAHRVPCLLSPLSWGMGSLSLPLMSVEAFNKINQRVSIKKTPDYQIDITYFGGSWEFLWREIKASSQWYDTAFISHHPKFVYLRVVIVSQLWMVSLNSIVKDCDHHSLSSEATVPGRLNVHVKTASSPAIQMPLSLEKNRDVLLGLTELKMYPMILMLHSYISKHTINFW